MTAAPAAATPARIAVRCRSCGKLYRVVAGREPRYPRCARCETRRVTLKGARPDWGHSWRLVSDPSGLWACRAELNGQEARAAFLAGCLTDGEVWEDAGGRRWIVKGTTLEEMTV